MAVQVHLQINYKPDIKRFMVKFGDSVSHLTTREFAGLDMALREQAKQIPPNCEVHLDIEIPGDAPYRVEMVCGNAQFAQILEHVEMIAESFKEAVWAGQLELDES